MVTIIYTVNSYYYSYIIYTFIFIGCEKIELTNPEVFKEIKNFGGYKIKKQKMFGQQKKEKKKIIRIIKL